MQIHSLALFTLLVTSVAADGVRNGFERVWLWYAYQIDLELPADQRRIAVRCKNWDESAKICPPTYEERDRKTGLMVQKENFEACVGTRDRTTTKHCYFWEFWSWIDKKGYSWNSQFFVPTSSTDPVAIKKDKTLAATVENEQKNLKPDPTLTANWLSVSHPPREDFNPPRTKKYQPYRAFKGATDVYNDMLLLVGQHSVATISGLSADAKAANADNIDGIKKSLRGVLIERKIDSSRWIKLAAQRDGIKLFTYTENGHTGDIVDWDKSRALPENMKDAAATSAFDKMKTDFYNTAKAIEHEQVMSDYQSIENMYNSPACSGP